VTASQFDVCRVGGLRADSPVDLAVVIQDDTLSSLSTRLVAPLVPAPNEMVADRMTPTVELDGVRYAVATHLLMAIPVRSLGAQTELLRGPADGHGIEESALYKNIPGVLRDLRLKSSHYTCKRNRPFAVADKQ